MSFMRLTTFLSAIIHHFCQVQWMREGRTQMQFSQNQKGLFQPTKVSMNKRRGRAGSQKYFNYEKQ